MSLCSFFLLFFFISEKHFIVVRKHCLEKLPNIQLEIKAMNKKYVRNKMQVTINLLAIENT